jgi:YidC/Oxa1 family membrane protein insertase
MGNLRTVLIMLLALLGYMIWVQWERDYGAAPQPATPASTETSPAPAPTDMPAVTPGAAETPQDLPAQSGLAKSAETGAETAATTAEVDRNRQLVTIRSDVLELKIDLNGGTVISALLLRYPVAQKDAEHPVDLLSARANDLFIAQSGLLSKQAAPNHTTLYHSDQREFVLGTGENELRVPMTWTAADGTEVTKTFVLHRGSYQIQVLHELRNNSAQTWSGSEYDQLQRSIPGDRDKGGFAHPERYSFLGIGFFNPQDKFEKIKFDDVAEANYQKTTANGWLAMIQHYFFAAWIPPAEEQFQYSARTLPAEPWPRHIAVGVSPARQVKPGDSTVFSSRLYLGPKLQAKLPEIAPGLEHTVNYGIFTVFSKPLFWLLSKIHALVGNWGWAIVILTVLIKAAFFKLTEAQYRSTARMRKLQPRIEQLKERYGDDRQRMSQAMMEMYKKEKVNPLGGCLPIVVQIPIFIALYWVLLESVELRQAPFILWIDNLSVRDPYFILPLLNAGFMFATQQLTPMVGMDPLQQKLMKAMPIAFSVMFAFFPAGLVLYWATNAGLSLAQQYYITRKIAAADG